MVNNNTVLRAAKAKKAKKAKDAFSLVEMVITLFLFTILALALTKALTYTKYIAEDNLYEATALTVASSLNEQIKGASLDLIINPKRINGDDCFEMSINGETSIDLTLGTFNDLDVPVVTNEGGEQTKSMRVRIKPEIDEMINRQGYWITIEYEFDHPRSGQTRSSTVRNARSKIPSS